MKPKFITLIVLTLASAALLAPFAFSPVYVETLREQAFDLLQFLKGNLYKQITGYAALVFVVLEMVFTARKRGRSWVLKLKVPGSMQLWRRLHIFLGVALLGVTLIHTVGMTGINFNAIFLWVFFAVTLSALVGVVAETGILESSRQYFAWFSVPVSNNGKKLPGIPKGNLIRQLRAIWLSTHILLVSVFLVMLLFHIFLAYYYQ